MGVIDDALNFRFDQFASKTKQPQEGTITSYDKEHNRISVRWIVDGGYETANWLSVPDTPGVHHVEPKPGWRCGLSFAGGNIETPIVTSIMTADYGAPGGYFERLTHEYGVSVPDLMSHI